MKSLFVIFLFASNFCWGQSQFLVAKLDSTVGKYGYVDTSGQYIIAPKYELALDFISEYASVKVDSLWGVIDEKGAFIMKPQFKTQISTIYRNHFIRHGSKNIIFQSIDGTIKYEYLFIPGPFKKIAAAKDTVALSKMEDAALIMRILDMSTRFCHLYELNRIYNAFAIGNEDLTRMSINYVLDNPEEVLQAITRDIEYEKAYANGDIGCCGQGPFRW